MMQQYQELKRRYPDHLLFFRLGDFYETFFEDAELAARLLQITLTARQGAPMAGIPHHAADGYIARLVRAGQKIAVCEQLEAPGPMKKLLRRGVVRIITPGTLTDTAYLEGAANNFLLTVVGGRDVTGVALVDVSTGEFWAGEDAGKRTDVLASALLRRPAEIVLSDSVRTDTGFLARLQATGAALTFCDPSTFAPRRAVADLCAHFRVESLAPFGVADLTAGLGAAAAALAYLRATQGDALRHLTRIMRLAPADAMVLDETAVVTLELLESSGGSVRDSLFGVLDDTVTPRAPRRRADPRQLARGARRDRPRRPGGAGVDRGARGAGAGADRHPEPSGPLQSGVRLRHRGDPRPRGAGARRVRAAPDARRRRALRDAGAQGVRGEGARRGRAVPPARVRAVRGRAPPRGGAGGRAPGDRAGARPARCVRVPGGGRARPAARPAHRRSKRRAHHRRESTPRAGGACREPGDAERPGPRP